MNLDRFALNAVKNIAYHEVGHQLMAENFGCSTEVSIWASHSEASTWEGVCKYRNSNGLADSHLKLIGVSGLVGEAMHTYGPSAPISELYDHVCHVINTSNATRSDMELIGMSIWDDLDSVLVIDATKILREHWEDVERNANALFAATCRIFKLTNKVTELWNTH